MIFETDNIKVSVIKKIRKKYIGKENFTPEKAANASKAAAGLCKWVLAMESYDRVAKVVAPKKALLAKSEGDLKIVLSELGEKKGMFKIEGATREWSTVVIIIVIFIS